MPMNKKLPALPETPNVPTRRTDGQQIQTLQRENSMLRRMIETLREDQDLENDRTISSLRSQNRRLMGQVQSLQQEVATMVRGIRDALSECNSLKGGGSPGADRSVLKDRHRRAKAPLAEEIRVFSQFDSD